MGIEVFDVDVEISMLDRSMPSFDIVGLASREVSESRERVRSAFINAFKEFPYNKKILVNLAPADVPKEGSYYDLAITAGLLSYMKGISFPLDSLFFGEVSLDGGVRHLRGSYLFTSFAKEKGINNVFIPSSCYDEVRDIEDVYIYPVSNIRDLLDYQKLKSFKKKGYTKLVGDGVNNQEDININNNDKLGFVDFSDIIGQDTAKRALEISASGGHNVILKGSPGSGKTMLAKALCGILPNLSIDEKCEVAKIYSACGLYDQKIFNANFRPFRSPHHTITYSGMVGGGLIPKPGEISLAHKGVLFLDELLEFQSSILECLRQPMEEGFITITRAKGSIKIPCDFTLVACLNPCPCGYFGDDNIKCVCKPWQISQYSKKLSGPILDRIDIKVKVYGSADLNKLSVKNYLEKRQKVSHKIREKVLLARDIQKERFKGSPISLNARMSNDNVKDFCKLDVEGEKFLDEVVSKFNLSSRSVIKVLKVARTIADMEKSQNITISHISEAVQFNIAW